MRTFLWCTNTNAGGDHEKTAQPIVRANRRCSELPVFDPSGKASCFPKYLFCLIFLIALDPFRKAKLCTELLQTVAKVDSGFSQFRLEKPRFKESKKSRTM